jgi:glutathione peroxidase-family protein
MKLIVFALIFSLPVMAQDKIYDLYVQTAYGGQLSMNYYHGQKIVIAAISVDVLQKKGTLEFWDSLKTAYPKHAFILVPASDMDTLANDSIAVEEIKSRASQKLVLSSAGKAKKASGQQQEPIMQWLTDANRNERSDTDVESDVQIFVISESGVLYSVLVKDTPLKILKSVLEQPDVTPNVYGELKP